MSIATVITGGFGSFGSIPFVIRDGYDQGVLVEEVSAPSGVGSRTTRRPKRYSDIPREEYEEQLRAMKVRPFTPLEQAAVDLSEDEDDELLLKVLALMVIH